MKKHRITITYNAPVTLTFVLICLGALVLGYITNLESTQLLFMTYRSSWWNPLTYLRLFTHVFGHVSWSHFFGNMTYILLLGPMVEEKYGSKMMIFMMGATALIAGIVNTIFFPNTALCGASGICFMLIVLSSVTSIRKGEIPLTLILILVVYLGTEIYDMIFVEDSVSQLSHIIGGVVGAFFGLATAGGKYK